MRILFSVDLGIFLLALSQSFQIWFSTELLSKAVEVNVDDLGLVFRRRSL